MANWFSDLVNTTTSYLKQFKADPPTQVDSVPGTPPYNPIPKNWYQAQPYAFKARRGKEFYIFYLPISPKNLNIVSHFATNVISTLYGTVEEHSEIRYFDITINGTTGFAPQFTTEFKDKEKAIAAGGRKRYEGGSWVMNQAKGFMGRTMGKIQNALNQASTAVNALGNTNPYSSGITNNASGYIAFHNFYKFLILHKNDAVKNASLSNPSVESMNANAAGKGPLVFLNYKDNNQYDCAIQRFTLERNADNPMLYNYTIQMRAYNLSPIISEKSFELTDRYKNLGLDSTQSIAAAAKIAINSGKSALSSAKGAIKTLGA